MPRSAIAGTYDRLRPLGFNHVFVRECILPDWWEDSLSNVPANLAYAQAVIARQLGMELARLRDPESPLEISSDVAARFKVRGSADAPVRAAAQTLGYRLAVITTSSLPYSTQIDGLCALEVRERILSAGAPWVGLGNLTEFCWDVGIPVIHLCRLPKGAGKIDGMALRVGERPVIVIASHRQQPAWHLFVLAHELGHILLGHVSNGEAEVDAEVRMESSDREEIAANEFAVELITGHRGLSFKPLNRWISAAELADLARRTGEAMHIDPGFIALNYSRNTGFYPLGQAALKELSPSADACGLYRSYYSRLDLDQLTEDSRHVFESLTEIG